jgi:hypothetical protein
MMGTDGKPFSLDVFLNSPAGDGEPEDDEGKEEEHKDEVDDREPAILGGCVACNKQRCETIRMLLILP